MEKSFRDILAQFLEEETSTPAPQARTQPAIAIHEFPFRWQAPASASPSAKSAYPAPPKTASRAKVKASPKAEVVIALSGLGPADRAQVDTLIRLGAGELADGVSSARLKKAYRRLAKRLHPDVSPGTALQFMELKRAYAALSASGCGSESASAPKTQRPDAA